MGSICASDEGVVDEIVLDDEKVERKSRFGLKQGTEGKNDE